MGNLKKIKKIIKRILIIFYRIFFSFFYDKKYLRGKYFDDSLLGWSWCKKDFFPQKILGKNRHLSFPCSPHIVVSSEENLSFDPNDINNFQGSGNYYQNFAGKITIGKGSYIAMNVGLITANHRLDDLDSHQEGKDIILGKRCWIGMNAVLLPGVILGDHTIVGAGSIVTKSFPDGYCIIAGNPAKIIRKLDMDTDF